MQGRPATLGASPPSRGPALYPYGGIVYKAGPSLPVLDGSARAYKIVGAGAGAARRLADALGLKDVTEDANSTFTDGDAQLSVSPVGDWGYTRQSSGGGVASSGVAVACAPNADCPIPPTTIPQHPADLPSQDDAKASALALLQRAGIDTDHAVVSVDDAVTQWIVRVDPVVDGVPTDGFTTTVTIGENGVVEYASGILGAAQPADEYPLIGTNAAIERLNNGDGFVGPRPLQAAEGTSVVGGAPGSAGPAEPAPPLLPCDGTEAPTTLRVGSVDSQRPPVTDTIPPPPPPQEITLTGAERILLYAVSYTNDESWLVPAYRFRTDQGAGPSVLAIDDTFLTPPDQVIPESGG